jgi:hypothetical protein
MGPHGKKFPNMLMVEIIQHPDGPDFIRWLADNLGDEPPARAARAIVAAVAARRPLP